MCDFSELKREIEAERRGNSTFYTLSDVKESLSALYDYANNLNSMLESFSKLSGSAVINLHEPTLDKTHRKICGDLEINCKDLNRSKKIDFVFSYPNNISYNKFGIAATSVLPDLEEFHNLVKFIVINIMAK